MKFNKITFFLAALVGGPLSAQSSFSGMVTLRDGTTVWIDSTLEPPEPAVSATFTTSAIGLPGADGWGIRRYFYDKAKHIYFGYDALVRPASGGSLGVTFKIVNEPPHDPMLNDVDWARLPAPLVPAKEEEVKPGDTIVFNLFQNPTTGQTIVEHIRFDRPNNVICGASMQDSARLACLERILEGARQTLEATLRQARNTSVSSRAFQLARSQPSWELYQADACRPSSARFTQLSCEISLTRSRAQELTLALTEK